MNRKKMFHGGGEKNHVGDFSIMERVFHSGKLVRGGLNGVDEFSNRFGWVMYYVVEFATETEAVQSNILLKFSLQERSCVGSKQSLHDDMMFVRAHK